MRALHILIFLIYSYCLWGQKSNLYQIFADDINQQTFVDKKTTKISRVAYSVDTLTGKLKKTDGIVKMEYYPDKKLCKTINTFYKTISYWKSDTNGYNNFSYDKHGKMQDVEAQDASPLIIENNRVKMIYGDLLFYDESDKIIKTITNTTGYTPTCYWECYYSYRHDSLIESKCYSFKYFSKDINLSDTLVKRTRLYDASGFFETIIEKSRTVKIINYTKDNVDINENYVNGKLESKVETYYK